MGGAGRELGRPTSSAPSAGGLSLVFDRYLGHRHRRGSIRRLLGTAVAALVEADRYGRTGYMRSRERPADRLRGNNRTKQVVRW